MPRGAQNGFEHGRRLYENILYLYKLQFLINLQYTYTYSLQSAYVIFAHVTDNKLYLRTQVFIFFMYTNYEYARKGGKQLDSLTDRSDFLVHQCNKYRYDAIVSFEKNQPTSTYTYIA